MILVLIGFMGSGKSAVGRVLARCTGARLMDLDEEVVKAQGMSIPEIFATRGEEAFRRAETAALRRVVADADPVRQSPIRLVVSTGGGTPLHETNRAIMKQMGRVVWLRARPETIAARVGHALERRPLIAEHADDLLEHITALMSERAPHYQKAAHLIVDTDRCISPRAAAERVLRRMNYRWQK